MKREPLLVLLLKETNVLEGLNTVKTNRTDRTSIVTISLDTLMNTLVYQ